jgi:ABC-2 type transport system permease protein
MKRILTIGWKDLLLRFRDRGALTLMLGAPFVLTLAMGLVTGAFSPGKNNVGPTNIPIAIINEDNGRVGDLFVQTFNSEELADLVEPLAITSAAEARQMVANNQLAAALLIPPTFSQGMSAVSTSAAPLEIVTNPARPISSGIVRAIITSLLDDMETGLLAAQITQRQLIAAGRQQEGEILAHLQERDPLLNVKIAPLADQSRQPTIMAYLAPAFAVLFLMYTVTQGGRSILDEREKGTLARLMINPLSVTQILGGKVSGIFLSGFAQMSILILASSLFFGLRWGTPLAVTVLLIAIVAAASGWGLLLAAVAKNTHQVNSIGTAMMLIFGILGGSFFALPASGIAALLSKITPNAWAIEGFTTLAAGGTLSDIGGVILALSLMAIVLFALAGTLFRRRPLIGG